VLKRFGLSTFAVCSTVALLLGCGGSGPSGADRPVPERIVTLAPNLTELAFALGLGPRVVGVSDYVTWPPEALERPHLGGLFDPNLETVVSLRPDLAIVLPSQAEAATRLERAGIATLTVGVESVEDVARAARTVGERCGVAEAGRALAARLTEELAPRPRALDAGTPSPDRTGPLRVLLSVDRAPGRTENLLVAGPGTYLSELVTRLGAVDVFEDAPVRYPQVGMEEVLARAPDAILEIRAGSLSAEVAERLVSDWGRYPNLPAVRRGAVVVIAEDYALVPGPRLPRLYDRLETALRRTATGRQASEDAKP
jgi:iron complex transport system substrate-binding protein